MSIVEHNFIQVVITLDAVRATGTYSDCADFMRVGRQKSDLAALPVLGFPIARLQCIQEVLRDNNGLRIPDRGGTSKAAEKYRLRMRFIVDLTFRSRHFGPVFYGSSRYFFIFSFSV